MFQSQIAGGTDSTLFQLMDSIHCTGEPSISVYPIEENRKIIGWDITFQGENFVPLSRIHVELGEINGAKSIAISHPFQQDPTLAVLALSSSRVFAEQLDTHLEEWDRGIAGTSNVAICEEALFDEGQARKLKCVFDAYGEAIIRLPYTGHFHRLDSNPYNAER